MTEESRKVLHTQWKITLPEEKESLSCATRRKLEDIILSAISQTIKDKTCVLIHVRIGVFPAISVNKDVTVIHDFSPPIFASEP